MLGPATAFLDDEVQRSLRQQGLLIWLDKESQYVEYVDVLRSRSRSGGFPFPVTAFRGSFLELLLELEPHSGGLDNAPLLVHMPGFNETSIKSTPLLELYGAGKRFRKALDSLVREAAAGRVVPQEIERFLGEAGLSLAGADTWLSDQLTRGKGGIAGLLAQYKPEHLVDALLAGDSPFGAVDVQPVAEHLERLTGLGAAWRDWFGGHARTGGLEGLATAWAGHLLAVEYVWDLKRPPHLELLRGLQSLPKPVVSVCQGLVQHLRERHPERYLELADEVEGYLRAELDMVAPEDLGRIDTFRAEEAAVLEGALAAMGRGDFAPVVGWAEVREGDHSFWLRRNEPHRRAWSVVLDAARLGAILSANEKPLGDAVSLEQAVRRYTEAGSPVDRAHRTFEQRWKASGDPSLPHFGAFKALTTTLRSRYREWADGLSRSFAGLCKAHGFLPPEALQQRTLYEQVVHPLAAGPDKVAVFLIDALRYEMACELAECLGTAGGAKVELGARLAELPTITAVGMNALAPVADAGRLQLSVRDGRILGFRAGESTVSRPEDRARAMGMRSLGKAAVQLDLREVCEADPSTLRRKVAQAKLLLVLGREIDEAGEAGLGLSVFDRTVQQIRSAWLHLQAAGMRHLVVTSDHGFLILDETTQRRTYGKRTDPSSRYVLAAERREEAGMLAVSMPELRYEPATAGHLLFLEDTTLFDTGGPLPAFVHGGNSLQERVIPVLSVHQPRAAGSSATQFSIKAECAPDRLGLGVRCIRISLAVASQAALDFATAGEVSLSLRVPDRSDVLVHVRQVEQAVQRSASTIAVRPGNPEAAEVYFLLDGPRDERVQVEVFHPDGEEDVTPALAVGMFPVNGRGRKSAPAPSSSPGTPWLEAISDEGARKVFQHIAKHGSLEESELITMLGSARAARLFAAAFDQHLMHVPFEVRIDPRPTGKLYVKERDR